MKAAIVLALLVGLSGLTVASVPAHAITAPEIQVTTSFGNQTLLLNLNQSGGQIYPQLSISIYGTGYYELVANNSVIYSGHTDNGTVLNYTFTQPTGSLVNFFLVFRGNRYVFSNETLIVPSKPVEYTFVSSTLGNNSLELFASPGQTAKVLYPNWKVTLISSFKEPYTIILNGEPIANGSVFGVQSVTFKVPGTQANAKVVIGGKSYSFMYEAISKVPVNKKPSSTGPPPQFTGAQVTHDLEDLFISSSLASIGVAIGVRKLARAKSERKIY